MFRFYNGLSPPLMNNIFKLRAENSYHGTESILYLGPKICDILPEKLKNFENLEHLKKEI